MQDSVKKSQAESLAVRYEGYSSALEAQARGEDRNVSLWAGMLYQTQKQTDIELVPYNALKYWMEDK